MNCIVVEKSKEQENKLKKKVGRQEALASAKRSSPTYKDSLPLDQQIALMQGLKLPIISMVFSGGKSIHALVDVARIPGGESVKDLAAWNTTIKRDFFGQLGPLGFDKVTSNSARLSRNPGCFRPDKGTFQTLIYINRNGDPLHV